MKSIIIAVCLMTQLVRMEPHLISASPPSTITPTAAAVQSTSPLLHTIASTIANTTAIPLDENTLKASMPPLTITESQQDTLKLVFLLFLVALLVVVYVGFVKQNRLYFGIETIQLRSRSHQKIRHDIGEDEEKEFGTKKLMFA
ncbi:hypothetical protein CRE_31192 [Caenorhabditis remanei]|uniref:Uncharacterized protein n=1 Tax=Caenorhabditis remanei TaxID=31234 RepID=E3MLI2_CAERE|nr:hypothetical protein CRE_31192 [Caenorhabditis remanei]